MPEAIRPRASEPLLESPDHFPLAMAVVLLILSPVDDSLRPVKLPNALHLALTPLSIVALSVEPSVGAVSVEDVVVEVALVVLQKLGPSIVLDHKILIFCHGFGRVLRSQPLVILLQFFA